MQLAVSAAKPGPGSQPDPTRPIVVAEAGPARRRFEAAFDAFRRLFPPALCYAKIVPVDEVITLTLFHREDDHLRRLMLDDAQAARLDRLWDELHFVSQDALTLVDAFDQILEYASQDADPKVFEPLRKPIHDRAAAFRKALVDAEPQQLDAVLAFAAQAYRRPLRPGEADELRVLYRKLRSEELPHDEALAARARPRAGRRRRSSTGSRRPGPGPTAAPVSDWELASRLSYFLWSSTPDDELRELAASGRLRDPDVLAAQARRMLRDDRVRRLATEFACQWLHVHDFDTLDEKSERHFPTFARPPRRDVRGDDPLLHRSLPARPARSSTFLDADHTFLNEPLARALRHPRRHGRRVAAGRRGQGVRPRRHPRRCRRPWPSSRAPRAPARSCGATGSPRSCSARSCPKPPKDVPQLPDDEAATGGLTVRQLVEKHTQRRRSAPAATAGSTRSASRSKATTPSAARATRTWATARSTPDAEAAGRHDVRGPRRPADVPAHEAPRGRSPASSAASCSATRWAAACSSPTSRCSTR